MIWAVLFVGFCILYVRKEATVHKADSISWGFFVETLLIALGLVFSLGFAVQEAT